MIIVNNALRLTSVGTQMLDDNTKHEGAKKVLDRRCKTADKPVVIQDVIVQAFSPIPGGPPPLGEYGNLTANTKTQVVRMGTQIQRMADYAGKIHKRHHFQTDPDSQTLQMKKTSENIVTRVITNEFLFYTKVPLSIKEYEQLLRIIDAIAKTQPENVQMILSSFAVRTPNDEVMNVVMQVDCGKEPRIQPFAKNFYSHVDPSYVDRDKDGNMIEDENGDPKELLNVNYLRNNRPDPINQLPITRFSTDVPRVMQGDGSNNAFNISHDGVFENVTAGGAKYFTVVDVCVDHSYLLGKRMLNQHLQQQVANAANSSETNPIPIQISHVVTSNWINTNPNAKIGNAISQADPFRNGNIAPNIFTETEQNSAFGTNYHYRLNAPLRCDLLPPNEMQLADEHTDNIYQNMGTQREPYHSRETDALITYGPPFRPIAPPMPPFPLASGPAPIAPSPAPLAPAPPIIPTPAPLAHEETQEVQTEEAQAEEPEEELEAEFEEELEEELEAEFEEELEAAPEDALEVESEVISSDNEVKLDELNDLQPSQQLVGNSFNNYTKNDTPAKTYEQVHAADKKKQTENNQPPQARQTTLQAFNLSKAAPVNKNEKNEDTNVASNKMKNR